jgi:SAM-dependent methyltransferase
MSSNPVPLNQTYRMKATYAAYPEIKRMVDDLTAKSIASGFRLQDGKPRSGGRRYDFATIYASGSDFRGKLVADLGARDGFFGAWLTGEAAQVHISDYFEKWGEGTSIDLGRFEYWENRWRVMAPNPERLVCETQDITKLTYPDAHFDVTICTSVIEHIWPNDMDAMREIVRITKPGGIIAMSTDMSTMNQKHGGTFFYNEANFMARLIAPYPVRLRGPVDFSLDHPDTDAIAQKTVASGTYDVMPCVYTLQRL